VRAVCCRDLGVSPSRSARRGRSSSGLAPKALGRFATSVLRASPSVRPDATGMDVAAAQGRRGSSGCAQASEVAGYLCARRDLPIVLPLLHRSRLTVAALRRRFKLPRNPRSRERWSNDPVHFSKAPPLRGCFNLAKARFRRGCPRFQPPGNQARRARLGRSSGTPPISVADVMGGRRWQRLGGLGGGGQDRPASSRGGACPSRLRSRARAPRAASPGRMDLLMTQRPRHRRDALR